MRGAGFTVHIMCCVATGCGGALLVGWAVSAHSQTPKGEAGHS